MDILEKLAETMYSFKAHPSDSEIEQVAAALVITGKSCASLDVQSSAVGERMAQKLLLRSPEDQRLTFFLTTLLV